MFNVLKGKGREVSSSENLTEIERVERAIAELEAQLGPDQDKLDALERQALASRYGQNVLGEEKPPDLERDIEGLKGKLALSFREIRDQREYLDELRLPLLESRRREAVAAYEAHIVGLEGVIRAEAEGLIAYMETRARSLEFEQKTRRLVDVADRLSRQLGEPDVVISLAPSGHRFRPESVMIGSETRSGYYQAAADRLRAVLDAGEAEIRKAQEVPNNERTGAQTDIVFLWGPGGEREQEKKAKATGRERVAARKRESLPV